MSEAIHSPDSILVRRVGNEYLAWNPTWCVGARSNDLAVAFAETEAAISLARQAGRPAIALSCGTHESAWRIAAGQLIAFTAKTVVILVLLAASLVAMSRILPMGGLSDLAAFIRLMPPEAKQAQIENARAVGTLTRPMLEGLGVTCPAPQ